MKIEAIRQIFARKLLKEIWVRHRIITLYEAKWLNTHCPESQRGDCSVYQAMRLAGIPIFPDEYTMPQRESWIKNRLMEPIQWKA